MHRQSRRTGEFSLRTTFPGEVDTENIEATPRRWSAFGARAKAEESKPRKIEIKQTWQAPARSQEAFSAPGPEAHFSLEIAWRAIRGVLGFSGDVNFLGGRSCCGTAVSVGTRTRARRRCGVAFSNRTRRVPTSRTRSRVGPILTGGGSGFFIVDTDDPRELTDFLQPYMDSVSWDVHPIYELS